MRFVPAEAEIKPLLTAPHKGFFRLEPESSRFMIFSWNSLLRRRVFFVYDGKKIRIVMQALPFLLWFFLPSSAWANSPRPWQMYFQDPATPVMEDLCHFHTILLITEGVIVLVVAVLLIFVIVRFRASKNKVPSIVSIGA